jgi:K+-sensing histidine kinase KdpD
VVLKSIAEDAYHLSDIITSLLVLAKTEESNDRTGLQKVRLDEVIFQVAAQMSKAYPDFKLHFEIENEESKQLTMELRGDETLLRIALLNLFKNAYLYSSDQQVHCSVTETSDALRLTIINRGEVPDTSDTTYLFNTFTRGSNSSKTQGSGIGLSIVRRILHYHQASIVYHIADKQTNKVQITFASTKV